MKAGRPVRLSEVGPTRSARVLVLLDEALERTGPDREAWLAELAARDPESDALLRKLLVAVDEAGADGFLDTRELLGRRLGQLLSAPCADATPKRQYGPYRVRRQLGQGGMGAVWLAERADGLFTRQIALKLVHPTFVGSAANERFARERAILAGLNHPHITRLLDAGFADDGQPYLALEYVEGIPLTLWCDQEHSSIRARVELHLQVLSAVQYAHANLVVHRDLKPNNILVTSDGQARLLDFGIARLLQGGEAPETALTQVAGRALTPAYASPEQIAGHPVTIASDIYSLGVVLYELLCGVRPYRLQRESAGALDAAIPSAEPVRPSQSTITDDIAAARATTPKRLRQALAGDLDTIVLKALKRAPAERYATVEAFAQDLKRSLTGEPVLARPDSAWYRLRKFVARNRLATTAAVLMAASLATGMGVATWQAIQARAERARAERVKAFIGSIFASASPLVSGKSDVTARDLLVAGADRVERELAREPAMAAELLGILSSAYHNLGEVDLALASGRRAFELADRAFPRMHPTRASILRALGEAAYAKGNVQEARGLLEQAIATQRHLAPPEQWELADSLSALSEVTTDEGRETEAIALARESLALMIRARGPNHPSTITVTGDLSNRLMIAHQAGEALEYAERAYRTAQQVYGNPDHPSVLLQLTNYAYALDANGEYQAAKERWQRIVNANKRTFNERGPQVSQAVFGLARSQERLGELKAAMENYRESLDMMNGYSANVSGETATRHFAIGRTALLMRRADLALRSLADAIAHGSKAFGPQSPRIRDAEDLRAAALVYDGDLDEAERLLESRIGEDRSAHAPSLPVLLCDLALLNRARGNVDASLAAAQEAWSLVNVVDAASPRTIGASLSDLGRAQLEAGRLELATGSLERAMSTFQKPELVATPQQAEVWLALGRVRLEQGRVGEAIGLLRRSAEFWEEFDSRNAFGGEAAYWFATALKYTGEAVRARQQFTRARTLLERSPWPAHRRLLAH